MCTVYQMMHFFRMRDYVFSSLSIGCGLEQMYLSVNVPDTHVSGAKVEDVSFSVWIPGSCFCYTHELCLKSMKLTFVPQFQHLVRSNWIPPSCNCCQQRTSCTHSKTETREWAYTPTQRAMIGKYCTYLKMVEITAKPKGRPPVLLGLDEKLTKFPKGIKAKGGVVNIHAVWAITDAFIATVVTHPLPCILRISV